MKKSIFKKAVLTLVLASGVLGLTSCSDEKNDNSTSTTNPDVVVPSTTPSTNPSTTPSTNPDKETGNGNSTVNPTGPIIKDPNASSLKDKYETISIAKALEIANEQGDNPTKEYYYVFGYLKEITNPMFGALIIKDDTHQISAYNTKGANGEKFENLTDVPSIGDEVVLKCTLHSHGGNNPEIKQAYIVEYKKVEQTVDPTEYKDATIAEARAMTDGSKVKISGVVSQITVTEKGPRNGFILVDDTQSIYVYSPIVNEVEIGNKITIGAEKTHYIPKKEADDAKKHGYTGAIQLINATLVENDKKTNEFNKNAAEEITVKNLVEAPLKSDITSKLYKVTGIVKKIVNETGFIYVINDLDGKTGSYIYSQANFTDFTWLDEYVDKVSTIYLTILNYKSTYDKCVARLLPVKVEPINDFSFDRATSAEFFKEYYVKELLNDSYIMGNESEIQTVFRNELFDLSATVSYTSSNDSIFAIATNGEKVTFKAVNEGEAVITVKVTADGRTIEFNHNVKVILDPSLNAITIAEAILKEDNTEVTVSGIVAASLVNQNGFYLVDDTAAIAVRVADLGNLKRGERVVIRGTKNHLLKDKSKGKLVGQLALLDSEILAHDGNTHDYSKANFITDKTFDEIKEIANDPLADLGGNIYVVDVIPTLFVNEQFGFSRMDLKSTTSDVTMELYCSGSEQYKWLEQWLDQKVTIELALCNWNDKKFYKGCVLSVEFNGEVTYNTLNFSK